jgi:HSP20 family protein
MFKTASSLNFAKPSASGAAAGDAHWTPNADMYVAEAGLVIKVELAGMRREDLELKVEGGRLHIAGQRPDGCRSAKCSFLAMEINYGPFEAVVDIPPGYDLSQAKASYQNGFLRVDVPAGVPVSGKTIPVHTAD